MQPTTHTHTLSLSRSPSLSHSFTLSHTLSHSHTHSLSSLSLWLCSTLLSSFFVGFLLLLFLAGAPPPHRSSAAERRLSRARCRCSRCRCCRCCRCCLSESLLDQQNITDITEQINFRTTSEPENTTSELNNVARLLAFQLHSLALQSTRELIKNRATPAAHAKGQLF